MQTPPPNIDELIALVITGEADAAQKAEVEKWRALSSENEKYYGEMVKLFAIPEDTIIADVDAAWMKVSDQIDNSRKEAVIRKMNMNWWQMAAAAVVIFMIGFYWYSTLPSNEMQLAATDDIVKAQLPDNSNVVLKELSSIDYKEVDGKRKVRLEGEAYFNVKHNDQLAFEVQVMELIVRDIGTAFNIRSVRDSDLVEVSVDEGEVELEYHSSKLLLKAGEGAVCTKGKISPKYLLQDRNSSAYATGKLAFVNAALEDVAAVLSKTFNVEIRTDEAIRQCALTADFSGEKLDTILEILSATMQVQVTGDERNIRLSGKGCI